MNRTKDELLLECIKQFEHIEDVLGFNRLSTTKSLIKDIEQALHIHDVVGRSEQLCQCDRPTVQHYDRNCKKCDKKLRD
jgi:hypothetical protein